MKRRQVTFFLAGLIAGLICVAFLSSGSPAVMLVALTWGVGPLFFFAVVAGLRITGTWRHVRGGALRYLAALILSTITYMLAVFTFFGVAGFSPDWVGLRPSANIANFGFEVWLGLIAAGIVAATGMTLLSSLLTWKWSKALLWRLLIAGLLTILLTFIANLPFQTEWSFFGVLFSVGNALFCCLVGTEVWQQREPAAPGGGGTG